jgi:hypothetical protein
MPLVSAAAASFLRAATASSSAGWGRSLSSRRAANPSNGAKVQTPVGVCTRRTTPSPSRLLRYLAAAGGGRSYRVAGLAIVPPAREHSRSRPILRVVAEARIWKSDDDYLIPNRRPGAVKRADRSDKVIWETVKTIAARAGVEAHVHALRAAFAVQFDEANPSHVVALKELMGHARIDQTLVYLRRKNKQKAMEVVRTLSWGGAGQFVFPPSEVAARKKPPLSRGFSEVGHTGFEPVPPP